MQVLQDVLGNIRVQEAEMYFSPLGSCHIWFELGLDLWPASSMLQPHKGPAWRDIPSIFFTPYPVHTHWRRCCLLPGTSLTGVFLSAIPHVCVEFKKAFLSDLSHRYKLAWFVQKVLKRLSGWGSSWSTGLGITCHPWGWQWDPHKSRNLAYTLYHVH